MGMYELSKVLAALLVEQGSYSHIDRVSQASSKDLALYYLREALRDFHSLLSKGFEKDVVTELSKTINFVKVSEELDKLRETEDIIQLREKTSLIAAQALAEAGRLLSREEYFTTTRIFEYLKTKNLLRGNIEELSKIIEERAEEISNDLGVPREDVNAVAKNKQILQQLIKKS
ncbi:MAG: hypothetical protein QXJ16_01995 [Desulfurococcaceae archaeon]